VAGHWRIEFGSNEHHWKGRGHPPARFVWFQLPDAIQTGRAGGGWLYFTNENGWRLANPHTGESLEGYFLAP
jgi:hypothetical protein